MVNPMADRPLDVVGIGNAIVDVLAHADEAFLARHGLAKGVMSLVDAAQAETIYGLIGPGTEMSGGSTGNTIAGIAALGGRAAFIGRVRDDQLGAIYRHDIRALGVEFDTPAAAEGPPTGRCLVLITPDAQRTMLTFLGICNQIGPEDIDEELIARAHVTYVEGYLWDQPRAKQAIVKAAEAAHRSGGRVAFTLSDPFCVDRHRAEFVALIDRHVDILFANEAEITSLYETDSFEEALRRVRGCCGIVALTRSEQGSVIVSGNERHVIEAEPVAKVVDTTGAGDLYAAGFLFGLTQGRDLATCGLIGSIAAAEVIQHVGARPERPLAQLVRERLHGQPA